jgi:hypothetical protein
MTSSTEMSKKQKRSVSSRPHVLLQRRCISLLIYAILNGCFPFVHTLKLDFLLKQRLKG